MSAILSTIGIALGVIFAFGLVVCIHEFGHFIVAKRSGVRVERFSFGLGPEIVGIQWGETRYCIALFPLGGEVRMAGDSPDASAPSTESTDPSSPTADHTREFFGKPWYVRTAIAVAGPLMNYFLAVVIFFTMLWMWGEPIAVNKTQVGEVVSGMPADKVGIKPGDVISKVQGESVEDFASLAGKIYQRPEMPTELEILRDGQTISLTVVPIKDERGTGKVGIKPAAPIYERKDIGPITAAKESVLLCWRISALTITTLAQTIWTRQKPDLAGPLGIGQVVVQKMRAGVEEYFSLIGLISVALGLFNLFPIPLLDGGHIFYYVIEGIRGRPVSQKVMAKANAVGLALLLGLLVFATMNDFNRIWGKKGDPQTETSQPQKAQ